MGVHGLWELLAPVGRRVSVDCLAGKRVAVDASIWMVQFLKATAAARGEGGGGEADLLLLAFFRRVCKLLFLRCKPVFVFDGATPPLKRRTLALRRRHRDQAQAKLRKTAERLLLTHLKTKRLEELAEEIRHSRAEHDANAKRNSAGPSIASTDREPDVPTKESEVSSFADENGSENSRASVDQEKLDEMLAASLAAEADLAGRELPSTSGADFMEGAENDEDDEEMVLPVMEGNIDPAVLASLPPSMQLDLLVQMRERVMAENRQKYQKIKGPAKFSELQIESYLKTVAFRREINEVQRSSVGAGVGDVHASRIASESNREFIFSSSFTGDKQNLARRDQNVHDAVNQVKNLKIPVLGNVASSSKSTSTSVAKNVRSDFGPDVETYRDERGRIRLSKVRAMGIRMTRDIQRNLDFIREYESQSNGADIGQRRITCEEVLSGHSETANSVAFASGSIGPCETDDGGKHLASVMGDGSKPTTVESRTELSEKIEISFLEDQCEEKDDEDQFFLHLASAGVQNPFPDNLQSIGPKADDSTTWEDGVSIGNVFPQDGCQNFRSSSLNCSGDEVEWEEGLCEAPTTDDALHMNCTEEEIEWEEGISEAPRVVNLHNPTQVSKGMMEEEALMQEAMRRSLLDFRVETNCTSRIAEEAKEFSDEDCSMETSVHNEEAVTKTTCLAFADDDDLGCENHEEVLGSAVNGDNTTGDRELPDGAVHHAEMDASLASADRIDIGELEVQPNLADEQPAFIENTTPSAVTASQGHNYNFTPSFDKTGRSYHVDNVLSDQIAGENLPENKVVSTDANPPSFRVEVEPSMRSGFAESNLEKEISWLRQEQLDLGKERKRLEGHAELVTSEMFVECQELLQMFGLPYIIAPMEAEAQCAYMEMKKLVDGVVTDDSDVFLFGARNVYKNIFDDRKYVETYLMKDIESELGLNRENLVRMALLLGSDYTEGVSGIGIVNAIEVVHAFPGEDGLKRFRDWVESPDPAILEKLGQHAGNTSKQKLSKPSKDASNKSEAPVEDKTEDNGMIETDKIKEDFMNKHRNVSKNWHLPSTFPSDVVINAYTSPQVDDSTDPFSWGRPDLNLLRKLCWEKFGWKIEKADELLVPVLKEFDKHETQLRLEAFYSFNERFAKIRSQRIKKAIRGISRTSAVATDEPVSNDMSPNCIGKKKQVQSSRQSGGKRKRSGANLEGKEDLSGNVRNLENGSESQCYGNDALPEPSTVRRSTRQRKPVTYIEEDCDTVGQTDVVNEVDREQAGDDPSPDNSAPNRTLQNEHSQSRDTPGANGTPLQSNAAGPHCRPDETRVSDLDTAGCFLDAPSPSKSYLFVGGGFCADEEEEPDS